MHNKTVYFQDANETVAIQRIKESMKEEVKKFEYDNHVPPAEYFA